MNKSHAARTAHMIQAFRQFDALPEAVTAEPARSKNLPGVNAETDQTMYSTLVEFGFIEPISTH